MKVSAGEADRFVGRPPKAVAAALIFGPDDGLVRERADALARTVVDDLKDPFRVADLAADVLERDGARLSDEAAQISMLGGRRVVRVRGAGNGLARMFERFLDAPAGDALVVVEAGDLAKDAALRKVFEDADNAAAVPCYLDSADSIADIVRASLKSAGVVMAPDALEYAVDHLGADRGTTRREIEKLALYAQGARNLTLEDARAVLGDESEARVEEVCDAMGEGDVRRLDRALERLWSSDMSAIAVLRVAMGHFQKLLQTKVAAARGESVEAAMRRWPAIHFSRAASFKGQLQRWTEDKLGDALDLLLETETLCKTTAVPSQAACGRALFNIAAMARAR